MNSLFKRLWPLLLVLASLGTAAAMVSFDLSFPLSGSMPLGLYRAISGPVSRGSVVRFCVPEEAAKMARQRGYLGPGLCPGGVEELAKFVIAISSDEVVARRESIIVNGVEIAGSEALQVDSSGRVLPRVKGGSYVVGKDEIWVISIVHPRSFDSRYFGPIPLSSVTQRLQPVFLFGSKGER